MPTVAAVNCYGESSDADFSMNSAGALNHFLLRFLGPGDEPDELNEITLLGDRLWLYIDGEPWEYANVPARSPEFLNVVYPVRSREGEIIVVPWRGHVAVRKTSSDPWTHLSLIYDKILSARKLEWGFKSRDWQVVDRRMKENLLPPGWKSTRYQIKNDALKEAIAWCSRHVGSDAAYRLPDSLAKAIGR